MLYVRRHFMLYVTAMFSLAKSNTFAKIH